MCSLLCVSDFATESACFLFVCQQFVPPAAVAMSALGARLSLSECQLPESGPSWPGRGAGTPQGYFLAFLGLLLWSWARCFTHLPRLDSPIPHPRWGHNAGAAKAQHQRSLGASLSGSTKRALKDPGLSSSFLCCAVWEGPSQDRETCRQRLHWAVQFTGGGHSHQHYPR